MSGLSTQFTSISEDLTSPPECRKSYVLAKLAEEPKIIYIVSQLHGTAKIPNARAMIFFH